jgi:SHS2 domain-containing protein
LPRPSVDLDPHAAELKLTIRADSLRELFEEAARVVSRECGSVQGPPGEWERIILTARDAGTLLVDWINELIGRSEVTHRAFNDVRLATLTDTALEAEVRGRPVSEFTSALKAATFHGLRLAQEGARWRADVLIDV